MRFYALLALAASTLALRLEHTKHHSAPVQHALAQVDLETTLFDIVENHAPAFLQVEWENLTDEQMKEFQKWIVELLTTGDKLIQWKELKDGVIAFGKKHGFEPISAEAWAKIKEGFDKIDTSGDGAVSVEELQAALNGHEDH